MAIQMVYSVDAKTPEDVRREIVAYIAMVHKREKDAPKAVKRSGEAVAEELRDFFKALQIVNAGEANVYVFLGKLLVWYDGSPAFDTFPIDELRAILGKPAL